MSQHIVPRALAATGVAAIASLALALPASAMPGPDPGPGPATAGNNTTAILPPAPDGADLPIVPVGVALLAGLGIGAAAVTVRTARRAHPGVA